VESCILLHDDIKLVVVFAEFLVEDGEVCCDDNADA
jgi:hypothetical protein